MSAIPGKTIAAVARRRGVRPPPSARAQRGFTLLELMSAFVVFAIGFAILMEITTSSLRMARRSATYTQAALLAQSKLDQMGVGEELEEGSDAGEFEDDRFRWEVNIQKQEPPAGESGLVEELPIHLMRVELIVRWDEGKREREAKFITLRAIQPKDGSS